MTDRVVRRGDASPSEGEGRGPFAFGHPPTLAAVLLVPQMGKARRFGVALRWPRLEGIEAVYPAPPALADIRP